MLKLKFAKLFKMQAQTKNFRRFFIKGTLALFLLLLGNLTFIPIPVSADNTGDANKPTAYDSASSFLNNVGKEIGLNSNEKTPGAYKIIGGVINMIIGFSGILFFALIIWAGYQWMTAGGKEEKVSKAITIFKESIIGLGIVILAFLFVNFVMLKAVELIINK